MKNWYYRLQMKEAKGKRIAESMLEQELITSDLDYAGQQFGSLSPDDVILVHKGAFPIALVRVKSRVADDDLSDSSFGIDYKVDLLSKYQGLSDKEKQIVDLWGNCPPTGTFFKINRGNETFNRIDIWYSLIVNKMEIRNVVGLLMQKHQVIFQGPPGTGKTRLAKEVAAELCKPKDFSQVSIDDLKRILIPGLELKTLKDEVKFSITEVGSAVRLKISTGNDYSIALTRILNVLTSQNNPQDEKEASYLPAVIEYLRTNFYKINDQVQLIQFHPSYSYEDFVRGIRSTVNDGQIEYVNENRILAAFAKKALDNFRESNKDVEVISKEKWASSMMQEYADSILEKLEEDSKYKIGTSVAYIFDVEQDAFRYKGDGWERHQQGLRMKFDFLVDAYLKGANNRKDFKAFYSSGLVNQHATYFSKVLLDFKEFLKTKLPYVPTPVKPALMNFVLIIDEINRANLSSVLGELIYALEYRNEPVSGMYAVDDDHSIVLPPNLFIIGTMNTADRSVGHIDYAIRRRFAFYSVLPDASVIREKGSQKANQRFKEVQELFVKDDKGTKSDFLSPDFDPNDVMLGHSYFLESEDEKFDLRMKYEIKPILKEYVKDGILTESALERINGW